VTVKNRILLTLWFLMLVNYLDRVAIGFAGPAIMRSLSMSPVAFGMILSAFSLGYLLAQLPGGLLADRFGARTMLMLGPLLWALFTGLTGLVITTVAFILVRTCFGFSEGMSNTAIYKMIGEHFPADERSRAFAIFSTAIPLAPAFAGSLIGVLITELGWREMFFLMTVPSCLAAVLIAFLVPKPSGPARTTIAETRQERAGLGGLASSRALWLLTGASLAWNLPYWGFLGWMPSYLAMQQHIDLKAVGVAASIPYGFAFLGMLVFGWLGSRVMRRHCVQLIVFCFLFAALSLWMTYHAMTLAGAVAGLSGVAFFLFGTHGPIGKIVLDRAPAAARGAFVGIYTTGGQVGGLLAPVLIGWSVDVTKSFAAGIGLMIVGFVIAASCLLFLLREDRIFRPVATVGNGHD